MSATPAQLRALWSAICDRANEAMELEYGGNDERAARIRREGKTLERLYIHLGGKNR